MEYLYGVGLGLQKTPPEIGCLEDVFQLELDLNRIEIEVYR
jgi:hypothetical protein